MKYPFNMRVLFVTHYCGWAYYGGAEVQAQETARQLESLGVEVFWFGPHSRLDEMANCDLMHLFGAYDYFHYLLPAIEQSGKPYVLSTIYYRKKQLLRILAFKTLKPFLYLGLKNHLSEFNIQRLLNKAALLLPNSRNEELYLKNLFTIDEKKVRIIPNGVESRFLKATPDLFLAQYHIAQDFALYTGRIGAMKNTLSLIRACKKAGVPLVIIGSPVEEGYFLRCKQEGEGAATFIPALSHDDPLLASAYAACKLFVLPSWYETTGISALEAALAGANIAITKYGGTEEYFGDSAIYLDPYNQKSIDEAVVKGMSSPKNYKARDMARHFAREEVAKLTLDAYKEVLG